MKNFFLLLILAFASACTPKENKNANNPAATAQAGETQNNHTPPAQPELPPDTFQGPPEYQRYLNSKFDFCVEYPANFLHPGEQAEADGRSFVSRNGNCAMVAYGYPNDSAWTIDQYYSKSLNDSLNQIQGITLISHQKSGNQIEIIGKRNQLHYITRIRVTPKLVSTVYFEYPASMGTELDPVAKHIAASFPACGK